MEQVQVTSPPISFACDYPSSLAANQIYYLENRFPANIKLPNPCRITRVFIWNETNEDYPSDMVGNISFAIDPGKEYIKASGFPETQTSGPLYLKTLGILEMRTGMDHEKVYEFNPPLAYRPYQDAIVVAPETFTTANYTAQIYLGICFEAENDISSVTESIPVGATAVYQSTLDSLNANLANYSIRNLIPAISAGGTQVRVRVSAGSLCSVVNHASVGIQSGATSGTTAAPVELKFGGNSGVTIAAYKSVWSDWVNLTTTQRQNLLATVSMFGSATNWAYKTINADGNWNSQSDSWNTAAMQGTVTHQPTRSHIVDGVQVK